ncbi:hypothetical protein SAMN05216553_102205 [Lentzea fradiae]|uniref:Uncharacterized protein n=1 Tax=Lentzea fradiae TaxID=200378 RepID=A0A1G7MD75_9PSEU|nr:hypothetical protein [Lentzea fradiae]SDF59120.1 hypothetical protein SAMN05216553_102205 [Lentzea fradiae]
MSEQEIREGMLLAVWDEPPLDFDPDTLIRRVEQKKSRRRALVAVGVATAMIVVASFALPGLLPRDREDQLASEGPAPSASVRPSEPDDKRAQRIGDLLSERLMTMRPELADVYATTRSGHPYSGPTSTTRAPGDPDISGHVLFTDQIGPTALRVEVGKLGFGKSGFCFGALACRDLQQKDGSVVTEAEFTDGGPDIVRAESVRVFQDGLVVRMGSFSYNPATGAGLRQTVPLRVSVLTTLVTDNAIPWR